ncbi:MAG: ribose ABC transporter permease [Nitrospiraceae bacterium]|nr:MAG: ribose ABC transporter permease [Nitrospiraceae bacterium]
MNAREIQLLDQGRDSASRFEYVRLAAGYHRSKIALIVVIVGLGAITTTRSDVFLTWGNFTNILIQTAIVGILAAGTTMLMVSGGIDLSVGSNVSFSGVVMGYLMAQGLAPPGAVMAGVAVAAAVGLFNGLLAAYSATHPFIVTLGMLTLLQGCALLISDLPITDIPDHYIQITEWTPLGLPLLVLAFFVVALAVHIILRWTVFGRWLYAIGGSESAARLAGVRVRLVKIGVYGLNGVVVGLAAALLVAQLSSAQPRMGAGLELAAIAAVAVGGTPLAGGKGDMWGTALGVLLIGMISNSLNLMSISSNWQYVIQGAVIIVAVMAQRDRR